ncbi:MAG: hypothetical protein ABWZ82_04875 [Candidatus Limnocylindrales bacterium]
MDSASPTPRSPTHHAAARGSPAWAAVHNNAAWCDAVCRAQGAETAWVDGLWVNLHPAPPYYSNAVTTDPRETRSQEDRLRRMLGSALPRPWSVKDGFHVLDLAPLGFRILFEAQWIHLPAGPRLDDGRAAPADGALDDVEWSAVTSIAELEDWERAWRGENPEAATSGPPAMFPPILLDDPDIRFLAGRRSGRTLAVAAANRSDDGTGPVVGISNIVLGDDGSWLLAGAVEAVRRAFPGLPMVGYERGDALAAMRALGFEPSGPLRVWITRLTPGPGPR